MTKRRKHKSEAPSLQVYGRSGRSNARIDPITLRLLRLLGNAEQGEPPPKLFAFSDKERASIRKESPTS